ncbi:malic enzyme [Roseovarius sp. TM1035]|nr:Hypothetical protein RAK1035_2653 [Roseovarius sp. AK1035]EDM30849.1 malic enzyme [Roseovarius sp. TM1035]
MTGLLRCGVIRHSRKRRQGQRCDAGMQSALRGAARRCKLGLEKSRGHGMSMP